MPSLSDEELRESIEAGQVGCFTADTSVFHQYAYDLASPTILALGQFSGGAVEFVLPDIVAGEVRTKMLAEATRSTDGMRKALGEFRKGRRPKPQALQDAEAALELGEDVRLATDQRWEAFLAETHPRILTASEFLDSNKLVRTYLETKPPFEPKEKKKAEFPDAIALLELEAFGSATGKLVLAVSRDNGWKEFAATSDWIVVLDELPKAFGFFHAADSYIVSRTVSFLQMPHSALAIELRSAVQRYVDAIDPYIEAHSYLFFETEFYGASYDSIEPIEETDVSIIDNDEHTVTLAITAFVTAKVTASFAFAVHDSIDKDYVPMGSVEIEHPEVLDIQVVAQVSRDSGPDESPISLDLESSRSVFVNFGEVEPDFGPYDEE